MYRLLLIYSLSIFNSCNSNEMDESRDINPGGIYFDYKIWGNEGSDSLTVKLQYRYPGENGSTLLLEGPSKAELDGELLDADSSKIAGVFYEVEKPIVAFSGKHAIVFTDGNNKQYKEVFQFEPISLTSPVPAVIQRGDLVFEFKGLSDDDKIRVVMTDTSFINEEINRVENIKNGRLIILKEELMALSSGPVRLEITKEIERPVKNGTEEGGRISISYGLKREFILVD